MYIEIRPPDAITTLSGETLHPVAALASFEVIGSHPRLLKLFAKHDNAPSLVPEELIPRLASIVLAWRDNKLVQFVRQMDGEYRLESEITYDVCIVMSRLFRARSVVEQHAELVANE